MNSELLATHVRVTVVFPSAIATNISANSGVTANVGDGSAKAPKIKMTLPTVAAEAIVNWMEKNKYRVLIRLGREDDGFPLPVNAGTRGKDHLQPNAFAPAGLACKLNFV